MSLLAIPNLSEGRDPARVLSFSEAAESVGACVLDVHSDVAHNRTVLTVTGADELLVAAMGELAVTASALDLRQHTGVHPRLDLVDVCLIVFEKAGRDRSIAVARATGRVIHERTDWLVYFYAEAATRERARELSSLRKGGLALLEAKAHRDLPPDLGAPPFDPRAGVVCVGARKPLIAFNAWVRGTGAEAAEIAGELRRKHGARGLRVLGLQIDQEMAQVSTNITMPDRLGIDEAFAEVEKLALQRQVAVIATEVVGLVPERYLPAPKGKAARLLMKPGRSVESALLSC